MLIILLFVNLPTIFSFHSPNGNFIISKLIFLILLTNSRLCSKELNLREFSQNERINSLIRFKLFICEVYDIFHI